MSKKKIHHKALLIYIITIYIINKSKFKIQINDKVYLTKDLNQITWSMYVRRQPDQVTLSPSHWPFSFTLFDLQQDLGSL